MDRYFSVKLTLLFLVAVLAGCEATAVKKQSDIRTKGNLTKGFMLPVDLPVAYYVDKGKPSNGNVNFYQILEDATGLVMKGFFSESTVLSRESEFYYLLRVKALSHWNRTWGGWKSEVELEVVGRDGEVVYTSTYPVRSTGAGIYDFNAVHNSFAKAVKEMTIRFFNREGVSKINNAIVSYQANDVEMASLKSLIGADKPSSTGTGFFISEAGVLATAAHVVEECLFVEVQQKNSVLPGHVDHSSVLLDLAVINTDFAPLKYVKLSEADKPALGKQVFVTGYPLSGILSSYPSLTVGNISSAGGLKGSKNHFQFSAPVQPGNSGGAIVDYQGRLVGVVSSSLNQEMMLKESGTTSQNVNFGVDLQLVKKFFGKHGVDYALADSTLNFEQASQDAVEYTVQILCYQ